MDGVEEVEVQLGLEVGAVLRTGRAAPAPPAAARAPAPAAEQAAEQVAEAADVLEVERRALESAGESAAAPEPTRAGAARDHLADLVVLLALVGVAEHLVCGRHLLEALLGRGVTLVGVGVELLRQLPVGALDLLVGRAGLHAEHGVVVLLEPFALGSHRPLLPPTSFAAHLVASELRVVVGPAQRATFTMAGRSTFPFNP